MFAHTVATTTTIRESTLPIKGGRANRVSLTLKLNTNRLKLMLMPIPQSDYTSSSTTTITTTASPGTIIKVTHTATPRLQDRDTLSLKVKNTMRTTIRSNIGLMATALTTARATTMESRTATAQET